MSRRPVMFCLLLAVIAPLLHAAGEPTELAKARAEFAANRDEASRVKILLSLVALRQRLAREHNGSWQAVDAEIAHHPMPAPADAAALKKQLAGKWASPRHTYLLRANGTWTMLPEVEDGVKATHGAWRVEGNRFLEKASIEKTDPRPYTIILLTEKEFVFTDGETVYFRTRGEAFQK